MLIGFVQGYEELKWGISKLNPLYNGPLSHITCSIVLYIIGELMLLIYVFNTIGLYTLSEKSMTKEHK